jgi:hypothetical protein
MRRLLQALAVALAAAPMAAAHGPAGSGFGYISTFAALDPPVLGVSVTVLGGDDRLQLRNYSGKTVEVLGYADEPFLRFAKTGIYENVRSPATFLSRVRDLGNLKVPGSVDAQAKPRWRKVSAGSSFAWHDHRIHWMGRTPPPAVTKAPGEEHRIFAWRVPARADGSAFLIKGFLGYRPAPAATGGSSTRSWEIVLLAVLAGAIAFAVAEGARRLRRRAP